MSLLFIKFVLALAFPSGGRGTIGVSPMVDEVYQTQGYPKALHTGGMALRRSSRTTVAEAGGVAFIHRLRVILSGGRSP